MNKPNQNLTVRQYMKSHHNDEIDINVHTGFYHQMAHELNTYRDEVDQNETAPWCVCYSKLDLDWAYQTTVELLDYMPAADGDGLKVYGVGVNDAGYAVFRHDGVEDLADTKKTCEEGSMSTPQVITALPGYTVLVDDPECISDSWGEQVPVLAWVVCAVSKSKDGSEFVDLQPVTLDCDLNHWIDQVGRYTVSPPEVA